MATSLTTGAVRTLRKLEERKTNPTDFTPILQVIKIDEDELKTGKHFTLTLSDGQHYLQATLGILKPAARKLFEQLRENSIIRVKRFVKIGKGLEVSIILLPKFDVITSNSPRIGNPIDICDVFLGDDEPENSSTVCDNLVNNTGSARASGDTSTLKNDWRLTTGAVRKLEEHKEEKICKLDDKPILQIIDISRQEDRGPCGSLFLSLSDGRHYLRALLTIPTNPKDREFCSNLSVNSIIRARNCFKRSTQDYSISIHPPFELISAIHHRMIGSPSYVRRRRSVEGSSGAEGEALLATTPSTTQTPERDGEDSPRFEILKNTNLLWSKGIGATFLGGHMDQKNLAAFVDAQPER